MILKNYIQPFWKIRAGALQYTIAFSLLITLVLVSFLLFNHLRNVELVQYEAYDRLGRDMSSARYIIEEKQNLFISPETAMKLTDELFLEDLDVAIKEWGFIHVVTLTGEHKNIKRKKAYFFSDNIHLNKLQPSLYLSAPRKHLSIGGKAFLGNNTFLPSQGIREAYINGVKYQRNSLVQGESKEAAVSLPKLRNKWINVYSQITNGISFKDSILDWNNIKSDSIINSFSKKRLVIKCQNRTIIDRKIIAGNILLYGSDIEIKKTSTLEGCIVLGKSISIDSDFKGAAQFIADNTIEIGERSDLRYPSVLYCSADGEGEGITIRDNCQITGDVISYSKQKNVELLKTGVNTKIVGQVYCHGFVTFHGSILGSMYCLGFIDRTKEGVFRNYIYDVAIDFERLPLEYGGISLITKGNGKKCIQEVI